MFYIMRLIPALQRSPLLEGRLERKEIPGDSNLDDIQTPLTPCKWKKTICWKELHLNTIYECAALKTMWIFFFYLFSVKIIFEAISFSLTYKIKQTNRALRMVVTGSLAEYCKSIILFIAESIPLHGFFIPILSIHLL